MSEASDAPIPVQLAPVKSARHRVRDFVVGLISLFLLLLLIVKCSGSGSASVAKQEIEMLRLSWATSAHEKPDLTAAIRAIEEERRRSEVEGIVSAWLSQSGGQNDWKKGASPSRIERVKGQMVELLLEDAGHPNSARKADAAKESPAQKLARLKGAFQSPSMDDSLAKWEADFGKWLQDLVKPVNVPTSAEIAAMSFEDLVRVYKERIEPIQEQYPGQRMLWVQRSNDAMKSLTAEIKSLDDARQARSDAVNIAMTSPLPFQGGWQGEDRYSRRMVFVVTEEHKPDQLERVARYAPIIARFVQDGEIAGTNALGATVRLPRFVDPPKSARHLELLELHRAYMADQTQRETAIAEQRLGPLNAAYTAMLDRLVVLAPLDPEAAKRAARHLRTSDFGSKHAGVSRLLYGR